jgi:hypothetical protein
VSYPLATTTLSFAFVAAALASGSHAGGAVPGAVIAGLTGILSILAIKLTARGPKPVQRALLVLVGAFLVRLVLVGVGTILVARASASIAAFVVAFFVPYFVLAVIEAAYVHSLRRAIGTTA